MMYRLTLNKLEGRLRAAKRRGDIAKRHIVIVDFLRDGWRYEQAIVLHYKDYKDVSRPTIMNTLYQLCALGLVIKKPR